MSAEIQVVPWQKDKGRLRVVVSGGGTGGHIYPALAIAEALKERCAADILYMGARYNLRGGSPKEHELAVAAGWPYRGVSATGLTRSFPRIVGDVAINCRGVLEASALLKQFSPQLVIGTGGYAMAPVLRAAVSLHIPTLLHEQNAYPGWANRYLAYKVDLICLTFAASRTHFSTRAHTRVTGLPVRPEIIMASREQAYSFFGIAKKNRVRPTLLVTGGSQGAKHLNETVCASYDDLLKAGVRIIHLTGAAHYEDCCAAAASLRQENLHILPYLKEMQHALALADLVVGRAGASFLGEIAVAGLPSILAPYPYAANDHQTLNAQAFVEAGAARLIPDQQLASEELCRQVMELLNNPEERQQMSAAAKSLAKPNAVDNIVEAALGLIKR